MSANFWVFVSFVGFLGVLVYAGVPRRVGAFLDTRRQEILRTLEDARTLREEAAAFLESCESKCQDAPKKAAQILQRAQEENERWAQERLENFRQQMRFEREAKNQSFRRAREQAEEDVRKKTRQLAAQLAQEWLKKLSPRHKKMLTHKALKAVAEAHANF